jgi:hypothetical protein
VLPLDKLKYSIICFKKIVLLLKNTTKMLKTINDLIIELFKRLIEEKFTKSKSKTTKQQVELSGKKLSKSVIELY